MFGPAICVFLYFKSMLSMRFRVLSVCSACAKTHKEYAEHYALQRQNA
jgi:hypothetical protein